MIDRGASPRRQLRYAWVVGQKEATQIDLSVATDMSRGLSTSGDVQVPTIRMIGTIEVIEERPDGTWVLEQVILEAGVPMGEADGIIAADVAEASVATLEGSAFRVRVDTRGNLYESETIPPPGLDPAQVDALESTTNSLEGLLLVLPRQRVGQGAVWRVDESFDGEMGFSVKQIRRTKLVEVDGDSVAPQDARYASSPAISGWTCRTHPRALRCGSTAIRQRAAGRPSSILARSPTKRHRISTRTPNSQHAWASRSSR